MRLEILAACPGCGLFLDAMSESLPPGQKVSEEFPRFGVPAFARYRGERAPSGLAIKGEVEHPCEVGFDELGGLPRHEQESDFHCVTTWSRRGLRWSGYRFKDVFEQLIAPRAVPAEDARRVVFKGADGYRASLPLEDALASDVLLADRLDGEELSLDHGAPLRVVAPAHYGYKNVKHLCALEFRRDFKPGPGILEHPRARVDLEERGRFLPGWMLRYLYRPLIGFTTRSIKKISWEK